MAENERTRQEDCVLCNNCGTEIDKDNEDTIECNGDWFCDEDCRNKIYTLCDICGNCVYIDTTVCFNDEIYCESCSDEKLGRCCHCEDVLYKNDLVYSELSDNSYCQSCYSELFVCCEACDREICQEDALYIDNGCYCDSCGEECDNGNIHDCSYCPMLKYYGSGPLYFGIELELENAQEKESSESIAERLPEWCYAKHDESPNDGFEAVTHPLDWSWIHDNKQQICAMLQNLQSSGMQSYNTETCGMHVHMSRKAFSQFRLFKMLKLFYDNPDFILLVSRRREAKLRRWASLEKDESLVLKAKTGKGQTRYTAINLENKDTIEIRIFRGTLSPAGFFRNIEFCQAVYDYTDKVNWREISAKSFRLFVSDNHEKYPNLSVFLRI